jgi:hypothetical protein
MEGIEVPVIAAQVQATSNGPVVAAIQIPPLPEGTRLLPRTLVHLFYLDMNEVSSPQIAGHGAPTADAGKRDPTAHEKGLGQGEAGSTGDAEHQQQNNRNHAYKTLFIGEMVGFQWTKTPIRRSLVLQCEDLSNYWDYAYQWSNTDIFGPGMKAIFSGGATNLFTDVTGLSSKGSVITSIITGGKCNSFPELKGMAAGIVRLIEGIGGTYFPSPKSKCKTLAGMNLFFSIAELRLRLTHMVHSIEKDKTSSMLLNRNGYGGMLDRALGGSGQQTSIRSAINALSKVIFYEMYPQPCPMYMPGTDGEVEGVKRVPLRGHTQWGFLVDVAEGCIEGLSGAKDNIENLGIQDNPTTSELDSYKTATLYRVSSAASTITFTIPMAYRAPDVAKSALSTALQKIKTALVYMKRLNPKSPASVKSPITTNLSAAIEQLKRIVDLTFADTAAKTIKPARMAQQIFKPDIWFGAPPRCNVIFPDQYTSFSYQRMYMQEPTRFLLKTNDEIMGEDAFCDSYYFAPQSASTKEAHAKLMDMMKRDMLDHELFTGILPVFEKMGEFNVFAAQAGGTDGVSPSKVSFAQRSANFLYFKHRFAARQGAVTCRFTPYVAVGFPGLIIDRYISSQTVALRNQLLQNAGMDPEKVTEILGTNYVGNFSSVTHTVSNEPERGATEIQMTFCRQPEERIEFMGALDTVQRVQTRKDTPATRSTPIAAVSPPRLFSLGPNMGRITNVVEVTNQHLNFDLPLFDVAVTRTSRKKQVTVPVGVPVTANSRSIPEIADITGDPDKVIVFQAYLVDEEIPRYKWEQVLIPAEELIRPGWYDKIWSPAEIGKTYESFFGIGAINDPQTIGTAGDQSEDVKQAAAEQSKAEDAEDPRATAAVAMELQAGATTQQAVEFLVMAYSFIKESGMDIEEFIRAYTWRSITTMVDIYGTSDLELSQDGLNVVAGIEGFHSRAFGMFENLFGLVDPQIEDILGITRDSPARTRADTRKRKGEKVAEYVTQLRTSRAILG